MKKAILALVFLLSVTSLASAQHCYTPSSYYRSYAPSYSSYHYPSYRSYSYYSPSYYTPSYASSYYPTPTYCPAPVVQAAPVYQYYGATVSSNGTYYPSGYYTWNGANWVHEQLGVIPLGNPVPTTYVVQQPVVSQPVQPSTVVIQQPTAPTPPTAPNIVVQPAPSNPTQLTNEDVDNIKKLREFFNKK